MKRIFVSTLVSSFLLILTVNSMPAFSSPKNSILFIIKNESGKPALANCGNLSYSGYIRGVNNQHTYVVEPAGFIADPRQLQYTCTIGVPILGKEDVAIFYPAEFDHSRFSSEVILTIHRIDDNVICAPAAPYHRHAQNRVLFSLSVDGQLIQNRNELCLYSSL